MSAIQMIIDADPVDITVTRHTKTPEYGGNTYTEKTLSPQRVRIYQLYSKGHNQKEWQTPEGELKQVTHGVLADINADFVCSHMAYDTFEFNNRTFRIIGVRRYRDVRADACTQCDCVAV